MTRTSFNTAAALGAATALIVATSIVEGLSNGRWSSGASRAAAVLASINMPATIGDWEKEEGPTRSNSLPETVEWTYRRQRPERTARLCLVAGDRRTLAGHGPQSCYPRSSLRLDGSPVDQLLAMDTLQVQIWSSGFWREEALGRRRLRALWTSRSDDRWTAAGTGPAGAAIMRLYLFMDEPQAESSESERLFDLARAIILGLEESLAPGAPPTTD